MGGSGTRSLAERIGLSDGAAERNSRLMEVLMPDSVDGDAYMKVPLGALEAHPSNREISQEHVKSLKGSILEDGVLQDLLVRPVGPCAGRYQIVAGHHRAEALRQLYEETGDEAFSSAPCKVREMDDTQAERALHVTNVFALEEMTLEERGREYAWYEQEVVPVLRREDSERYRGVRSAAVIADLMRDAGYKTSERSVAKALSAARSDSQEPRGPIAEFEHARDAGEVLATTYRLVSRLDHATQRDLFAGWYGMAPGKGRDLWLEAAARVAGNEAAARERAQACIKSAISSLMEAEAFSKCGIAAQAAQIEQAKRMIGRIEAAARRADEDD